MNSKKKILILNYGLHISGVSKTLVNFANSLACHGYDVTIKIAVNDFTLKKQLDERVKCSLFIKEPVFFGFKLKGFLRIYNLLVNIIFKLPAIIQYKIFVRERYDVEIAFNRGAAAKIISGSVNPKSKKLVWVHNDYTKNSNPLAGFKNVQDAQKGYRKFDYVVCVSKQAEIAFAEKFGQDFNLITRHNIMDVKQIVDFSNFNIINKDRFTIVAIGRLSAQKNYLMLLESIKILVDRGKDFDLWIVGDGELKSDIEEKISQLELQNVTLWGAKENPYPYLKCADLYVSSSIYEGLSTTTIEALILGKPIVATDCTGMRDILGDSEYGMVIPIEKICLANALETMMDNEKLRNDYSKKAVNRAIDFNPETAFKNIEELF